MAVITNAAIDQQPSPVFSLSDKAARILARFEGLDTPDAVASVLGYAVKALDAGDACRAARLVDAAADIADMTNADV